MGDGFQFLDIILLVMIAAFIFLRLRSVLGRRMGHEQQPPENNQREEYQDKKQGPVDDGSENVVPMNDQIDIAPADEDMQPRTPLARTLREIHGMDQNFNPDMFASQAEMAYEAIVMAFAAGDRRVLEDLLAQDVYTNFEAAITGREKAEEEMTTDILSIKSSAIEEASINGREAEITVRFETDMISLTKDKEGVVVAGDPHPHVVKEFWTFSRDLQSRNPNWLLITTRNAD
jgi:predicted lipid-binding transport protein (Tim44 family)